MCNFIKKILSSIIRKKCISSIKESNINGTEAFHEIENTVQANNNPIIENNDEMYFNEKSQNGKNIQNDYKIEELYFVKNQNDKQLAQIHIGLDIGTSFTKACWYYLEKDQRYIVQWDPNWNSDDIYFLPSILWLDDNNIISMRNRPEGKQRSIKYFKMMVAEQPIGKRIIPKGIQTIIDPYYIYSAFFISRCLSWIQESALKTEKRLRDCHVVWTGNIGLPISYFETKLRDIFEEIINAAYYMMENKLSDYEPIERIQQLYLEACSAEFPKHFTAMPELYAESIGLFSDYHTPEGFYTIFDIGGGTVDGAVIEFQRHVGLPKVNFLTSSVKPLGNEVINASSIDKQKELRDQMMTQTAELIIKAKNKVSSHWIREGRLPILMCGGGHSSEWHIKAIEDTYYHRQHYHCGIPKYDIQDLQVNLNDINNLPICDRHRFLTAIGLSFPEGMGPEITGFPITNPEFDESPRIREFDPDDRQRELYGEY